MCNASNHSPGCGCGFGPPYPLPYTVREAQEWVEEVVEDPRILRRRLTELGWDRTGIREFARRHALLEEQRVPKSSWPERFREWVGLRQVVVEASHTEVVNVPLYRLSAPPVVGATVSYAEGEAQSGLSTWALKFRGVGLGRTTSLEVGRTRTIVATNGAMKLLYVPVQVRVERVVIYDGEQRIGPGVQASVVSAAESDDPLLRKRGVQTLRQLFDPDNGDPQPTTHHDSILADLRGDTTGDPFRDARWWTRDVSSEVSVSLAPLADVSALVAVKRMRRFDLTVELPGGYDYQGYLGERCLWWESPKRSESGAGTRRRRKAA